jgi:hypothetical protein
MDVPLVIGPPDAMPSELKAQQTFFLFHFA